MIEISHLTKKDGSQTLDDYEGLSSHLHVEYKDLPVIYALEGHGETSLDTSFAECISKENIELTTINLLQYDKIISYLQNGGCNGHGRSV